MSPGRCQHPLYQRRLIVTRLRLVALRAARLLQHLAGPSLGTRVLLLELLGRRPLPGRAHQFFSATYFSIRLSSVSSATNSLSRLFSSSSSLSRLASSAFIPPYWFRQRRYVASLTSNACSTAAISFPALNIASASRSLRTISSGPCFLRFPVIKGLLAQWARKPS